MKLPSQDMHVLQVRLVISGNPFPWRTVSREKFVRTPIGKDPHSNTAIEGRVLALSYSQALVSEAQP